MTNGAKEAVRACGVVNARAPVPTKNILWQNVCGETYCALPLVMPRRVDTYWNMLARGTKALMVLREPLSPRLPIYKNTEICQIRREMIMYVHAKFSVHI
jgi:hypothetical protein